MNLERLLDKYMIEEAIDDYYCSKWYLIDIYICWSKKH